MSTATSDLAAKRCRPCESLGAPLAADALAPYLTAVSSSWELVDGKKIWRTFNFPGFRDALAFVNRIAALAEEEGHHPNLHLLYNQVRVDLTTHAIGGLSENDFIVARKIELLGG